MWADADTDIDFLNYSEIAELVAELIANPKLLPLSLGIFGGWGTGKSTTLRLVEAELTKEAGQQKYLIVKFDAWLYQDFDDARAALMSVISSALIDASPESLKEKAIGLLRRVNKLRLLGLAIEGGALAFGVPTFGAVTRGVEAVGKALSGAANEEDVEAVRSAISHVGEKATSLLKPAEGKGPPEEIRAFREEFSEVLKGLGQTLVVFIDNLDRCLPANAIHTLEAVRLFLFLPNTAFVVAADEDMIRHAVTQHFNNPAQRHVADYLDKLIQMPVRVPRLGVQEVRAYLFLLLAGSGDIPNQELERLRLYLIDKLRQSWSKNGAFTVDEVLSTLNRAPDDPMRPSLEMADRMAPALAHSSAVLGNPRIVKRMLNVVRMRASVARRRSMPLDEAIIGKLALFERCTDTEATEALHSAINAAENGSPAILNLLEARKAEGKSEQLPREWSKHITFLSDWADLEPRLGGIDLRPAVYLARETVPLKVSGSSVPPAVVRAVETLLKVTSISSAAGREVIGAVKTEDLPAVMEALIAEMRKNSDWNRIRSDFRGAFMVAQRSATAGAIFMRFIRSLQLPKYPGWMSTTVKGATWWEE